MLRKDGKRDYGSGGLGFESLRDHQNIKHLTLLLSAFCFF